MQKTLKITLLGKVYTITTDENEHYVMRAMDRINQLLHENGIKTVSEGGVHTMLPLLQLSVELEKTLDQLNTTSSRISSLQKLITQSL